jgi:hypothetical protein
MPDPETFAHQQWLGYAQPIGLVVSIPALLAAQAHINRNIIPDHQRFLDCLPRDAHDELIPELRDFAEFTRQVLGWRAGDLEAVPPGDARYATLEAPLPEYNETLRPTHVVRELEPKDPQHPWMMLIQVLPTGTPLDDAPQSHDRTWHAPPQARFERLLRETRVPIGLLCNTTQIRLVYAPRGETSGFATFGVSEMAQVAGRPIFAALHMLLCEERLFSLGEKQRLPAILADSRKYQNVVSTQLAEQVLAALYELVRGFQAADDQAQGELLREVLAEHPNHVYQGLLTVLMRLVFVLYAEDRNLLSSDPIFANYYSLTGLFERLRADDGRHPDTMNQRYGAWAQLLTLFRLIYEGGSHGELRIPPRHGYLFDPDRYNFLEGRPWKTSRSQHDGDVRVPRISDGVIFRVLNNLLILDGERLSYRTLDVEQIGSVYETMMGFDLEVAQGRSISLKPKKPHGAPTTINLEALLAVKAADRVKWLKDQAEQTLTGQALTALKQAATLDELLAALDRKIDHRVTPNVVSKGAMVLQPSDERRRSGSHYTPRSLTEPIVRTTLKPLLERLASSRPHPACPDGEADRPAGDSEEPYSPSAQGGRGPSPEQLLDLKICDPAMGSGAFLVEACRQLGDELVRAWHVYDCLPKLPPDEDEVLHARRLVAQRCLYGVDKNPMAVDLTKLSLWLATLAKDHPFTFLDHSLRCGDSLVGLSREQIAGFHWDDDEIQSRKTETRFSLLGDPIADCVQRAAAYRRQILAARDDNPYDDLQQKLEIADDALALARLAGDLVISAYFSAAKDRDRKARLDELSRKLVDYVESQNVALRAPLAEAVSELRGKVAGTGYPLAGGVPSALGFRPDASVEPSRGAADGTRSVPATMPFHWQIEFPEVFARPDGGFDAIVGNPPFAGKNTLIAGNRAGYLDWLKALHDQTHGNADLVAHFFRRAFNLSRPGGTFGLIATNTIGQGDTRSTGLRWICTHGGVIYAARKRYKWPGLAAVVVSVVHICKGEATPPFLLDGREVRIVTAYLFHAGGHDDPEKLKANEGKSFIGSYVLGMGFTFDDTASDGVANPISEMHRLIEKDPRNVERILPYIGGEEVNDSPTHTNHRFVINFGEMSEEEARRWPDLMRIVEERVRPRRMRDNRETRRVHWWRFGETTPSLFQASERLQRLIVISRVSQHLAFTFASARAVFSEGVVVFPTSSMSEFAIVQCGAHEIWGRFFASSLEERLRYTPSDCFETFPFPAGVLEAASSDSPATKNQELATSNSLSSVGRDYYEFRAALMIRNNEGLTKTYNRFHDPYERSADILKLRELHAAMDRAVLEAYGWHDLAARATCEFLLDYEDDDDEEPSAPGRRARRKPWRYRWPDDFRDEVLARLLALNAQRAEQERLTGLAAAEAKNPAKRSSGKRRKAATSREKPLLDEQSGA